MCQLRPLTVMSAHPRIGPLLQVGSSEMIRHEVRVMLTAVPDDSKSRKRTFEKDAVTDAPVGAGMVISTGANPEAMRPPEGTDTITDTANSVDDGTVELGRSTYDTISINSALIRTVESQG